MEGGDRAVSWRYRSVGTGPCHYALALGLIMRSSLHAVVRIKRNVINCLAPSGHVCGTPLLRGSAVLPGFSQ